MVRGAGASSPSSLRGHEEREIDNCGGEGGETDEQQIVLKSSASDSEDS